MYIAFIKACKVTEDIHQGYYDSTGSLSESHESQSTIHACDTLVYFSTLPSVAK
jgi:hypothetical protein